MHKRKRQDLRCELVAVASGPKTSIAKVLQTLQKNGLLQDDELGCDDELRRLTVAGNLHADAWTPYGAVVQDISLEMNDGSAFRWQIIHPLAYIWYVCLKCSQFADMMVTALANAQDRILSLLLYGDELVPGNPLRHDSGRQVFAFYFAFLEWPVWILHKSDAWILFGALRTNIIKQGKGGVSAVFAMLIRIMFVAGPANFTTGFLLPYNGSEKLVRASLKGIIADEKGLKEAFDVKGASGSKPCINCQNIFNFIHKGRRRATAYQIGLDSINTQDWIRHTDESVFELHHRLSYINVSGRERGRQRRMNDFQTKSGVNYNPLGLIGDPALQTIIKPTSQYIRDWQHTYCSNGVASIHLAGVLHAIRKDDVLKENKIGLETITEYCSHYTVPACHGRIKKNWFDPDYLAADHVKHFASDVLYMIPLLLAFMVDVVQPLGVLLRHIEGLALLNRVISFLAIAGRMTTTKSRELLSLIEQHMGIFAELYHKMIKIKFHHAGHLASDLLYIGVSLSCFPLERKHKLVKSLIIYAFRNVEMTCVKDYVNHSVQQFIEGRFQFLEYWLEKPKLNMVEGQLCKVSLHAHTPVGAMHRNDVVLALGHHGGHVLVGGVDTFCEKDGEITVRLTSFQAAQPGSWTEWVTSASVQICMPLADIRANLMWARRNASVICVLLPPALQLPR